MYRNYITQVISFHDKVLILRCKILKLTKCHVVSFQNAL